MKVLLINGSPHVNGNTNRALQEVAEELGRNGVDAEIFWIGNKAMQGCIGCYKCIELGHCIFNTSPYSDLYEKIQKADGYVIGTPVYYAGAAGSLCSLLDRLFYSAGRFMQFKPATAVAVARRAGTNEAVDRLNKYFLINNMPVVPSQYWNIAYGREPGQVAQDAEGLQTMRQLARNMAWMLKNLPHNSGSLPTIEPRQATNFIR